jgi:hypothetical protein
MKAGECGFVLPNHRNIKYIDIIPGEMFGLVDIAGAILKIENHNPYEFINYKSQIKRQFTTKS